ncbi:MAG: glycosyltransferase family 39 protein [Fibrobacteres bacterium]|nr:glycosyltransferase family 39 protein [Fibrobacterota bacterium]
MKKEIVLIFLFAFIVRISFLIEFSNCPSFLNPLIDAKTYWQMAGNLLKGAPITADWFWQSPFYPLFLALLQIITNGSLWGVKVIQALIGSGSCVLVYVLGSKIFDKRTALIAVIITLVYAPLLYFESEFLANVLETFYSLALMLLIVQIEKDPKNKKIAAALGLAGGSALFVRPTFIPFVIIAFLYLLWKQKRDKTLSASTIAPLFVGLLISVAPFITLRSSVAGDIGITPYSGGINLYIGNQAARESAINVRPGREWDEMQEEVNRLGYGTYKEASQYFSDKTIAYIKSHPFHFVKGIAAKSLQFVTGTELPRNEDIYIMREWSGILTSLLWKIGRFAFPFSLFFPLFIIGMIYGFKKSHWSLPLFIFIYSASIILVFNSSRYRTPIIPAASIFAAYGIVSLYRLFKENRRQFVSVLFLLPICVAVTMTGPYAEEKINYRSEYNNLLGKNALQQGRLSEARDYYVKAAMQDSTYDDPHYNLGCLYLRAGSNDPAITSFKKTIEINPAHKRALINLYYLVQMGGDTASSDSILESNYKLLITEQDMVDEWNRMKARKQ